MKKTLGVLSLSCLFCLSGCAVRMAGPCLGYGCPATGGTYSVRNAAPDASSAKTVAANKAPAAKSAAHSGN